MYESNNDSFEFMFQETSLLDNQPWNKGHGLYCELYPKKKKKNSLFLQEASGYFGIHPDCSSLAGPFFIVLLRLAMICFFIRGRDFVNI